MPKFRLGQKGRAITAQPKERESKYVSLLFSKAFKPWASSLLKTCTRLTRYYLVPEECRADPRDRHSLWRMPNGCQGGLMSDPACESNRDLPRFRIPVEDKRRKEFCDPNHKCRGSIWSFFRAHSKRARGLEKDRSSRPP